jgi:hypothetical protein
MFMKFIIFGAGGLGERFGAELLSHPGNKDEIVCYLDNNEQKRGRIAHGAHRRRTQYRYSEIGIVFIGGERVYGRHVSEQGYTH